MVVIHLLLRRLLKDFAFAVTRLYPTSKNSFKISCRYMLKDFVFAVTRLYPTSKNTFKISCRYMLYIKLHSKTQPILKNNYTAKENPKTLPRKNEKGNKNNFQK